MGLMGKEYPFAVKMVSRHRAPPAETVRSLPRSCSGHVSRGRFVGRAGESRQKVAVWVSYKKAKFNDSSAYRISLRSYADYMTRHGLLDAVDEQGNRLTLDEVHEKTHGWDDDPRYYKIVISPEHGYGMDLAAFTESTMEKVRSDLLTDDELQRGVQIEWVMAQHHDTDHPHVHVMMRAKADGNDIRFTEGYCSHGLRTRAEEIATGMLGYRVEREMTKEERVEVLMSRRAELGLDPDTGRVPTADSSDETAGKSKSATRDTRSFDGGLE